MIGLISAGASIVGGMMAKSAAKEKARAARMMADYNAKIQRMNAEAEAEAIEAQGFKLTKQQRESFARGRMSIAGRGGLEAGSDLSSLIDMVESFQLDQLELKRNADLSRVAGENQANMTIYSGQLQAQQAETAGRMAMVKGFTGALSSIAGGFAQSSMPISSVNTTLTPSLNAALGRSNSFVTRAMGGTPTFSYLNPTGSSIPNYLRR